MWACPHGGLRCCHWLPAVSHHWGGGGGGGHALIAAWVYNSWLYTPTCLQTYIRSDEPPYINMCVKIPKQLLINLDVSDLLSWITNCGALANTGLQEITVSEVGLVSIDLFCVTNYPLFGTIN